MDRGLEGLFHDAQRAWPGIALSLERFAEGMSTVASEGDVTTGHIHSNDLYLALGCLERDAAALAHLEGDILHRVRPSVDRIPKGLMTTDDVLQATLEKLVVGSPAAPGNPATPPKLTQYTGRGPLVGWVRVVAVREALGSRRRDKSEAARDEAAYIVNAGTPAVSLELGLLRQTHAADFREAVQESLRRLTPEQRSLLRFHVVEGLTIDQLAPMLGIHRATAARRLAKARSDALEQTQALLREKLGLSESEASSLCVALAADVDVSIGRALSEASA